MKRFMILMNPFVEYIIPPSFLQCIRESARQDLETGDIYSIQN